MISGQRQTVELLKYIFSCHHKRECLPLNWREGRHLCSYRKEEGRRKEGGRRKERGRKEIPSLQITPETP